MSTVAIDSVASYLMMNMTLAERQYLAQKVVAEKDEYGLLPSEREVVERYLVERAENALERADAGEYYSNEETKQIFADRIQELRQLTGVLLKQWQTFKNGGNVKFIKINK